jgi:hypothetical protein
MMPCRRCAASLSQTSAISCSCFLYCEFLVQPRLTTRGGVLFVLQNFLHGGPQYAVDCKDLTVARSAFAIFDLS